jgi:leucyl-tRNA synthetase
LSEELWSLLGGATTNAYEPWPTYDEAWLKDDVVEVPVQVNGKLRSKVSVPADAASADVETAARNDPRIAELLAGKTIVKVVVVPGRLVNFVIK